MIIRQIRVQEGFLDGLSVEFSQGLNVIIGARGTGKTSVIELLRFCLGAPAYTREVELAANDHATSVLGSGLVTVVVEIGGQAFELQRSAADRSPRTTDLLMPEFESPILLSQSELEKMALDENGRLRLLDDFRNRKVSRAQEIEAVQRSIASLTVEIADISAELSELRERQELYANTEKELAETGAAHKEVLESLSELQPARTQLSQLDATKALHSVQLTTLGDAASSLENWAAALTRASRVVPVLPGWPANAGSNDLLTPARQALTEAIQALEEAIKLVRRAVDSAHGSLASIEQQSAQVEDLIRPIRRSIDEVSQEAGNLTQRLSSLKEQSAQSHALSERIKDATQRLELLLAERRQAIEDLESLRLSVFDERHSIAQSLNNALEPLVHVSVTRSALQTPYALSLAKALQGSGLRYGTLAPQIAEHVSPRELAEAVERNDIAGLAKKVKIPEERASRVITHLATQSMSDILTAWVDDGVAISLLDGRESKPTTELSTGQRCTAILPILLTHRERVLIMDQPEDNLDNAFVVDTLIKAIDARPKDSQLIATTHNPNIPVLGEATNVVHLASTGNRGFVDCAGPLADPTIVEAITRVMEGGKEAFDRRAEFYGTANPA